MMNHEDNQPEDVVYYDPYIEEVVKKGKDPICGRVSIGLLLVLITLWLIIGFKSATSDIITTAAVTFTLFPLILLLFAGSLTLAIVSKIRKERGASANIAIFGLILCAVYYVLKIVMM